MPATAKRDVRDHIKELRERVARAEAWVGVAAAGRTTINIHWLVADQPGTPRMIFDKTGALAGVNRHDYLPFGEELDAGQGGRTPQQGYVADGFRQKFSGKERDIETGLDFFGTRSYANLQGRFISADVAAPELTDSQTLNKY